VSLSKRSLDSQLELCSLGDLVCCIWTDTSIGKTSTNGGVIDVPVRSWGIFVGVFGKRKHIILAQNSFEYADGLCDLDYTAIPLGWIEHVQIIAQHYTPERAVRSLVASFVRCDEEQKKSFSRSNRPTKVAKKLPNSWMYSVRTHSLRKFFRSQLSVAKTTQKSSST
jgi:hypothetical protein